jgi:hypothetical protein
MHRQNSRRVLLSVVAFAVATGALVIPNSAEAGWALFRTQLKTYTVLPTTDPIYVWWTVMPPSKVSPEPSATAYVGTTTPAGKITLPPGFSSWIGSWYCDPDPDMGNCWEGYPISGGKYSYINGWGRYGPNNPNGASMNTTVWFPTTLATTTGMYTTPTGTVFIPNGLGSPTSMAVTTQYSGRYDFDRGGSIKILPGANKFGGTMNYIFGAPENNTFYQLITYNTPHTSTAMGDIMTIPYGPTTSPDYVGRTSWTNIQQRYRVRPTTIPDATTTTTTTTHQPGSITEMHYNPNKQYTFTISRTAKGDPVYSGVAHYLSTGVPATTGTLIGWQPVGTYATRWTVNGYDNRSPNGLKGDLSLVSARLRHTYFKDNQGTPISTIYNSVRMYETIIMFKGDAPEPGVMLLLGAGVVTLAGLSYMRRR